LLSVPRERSDSVCSPVSTARWERRTERSSCSDENWDRRGKTSGPLAAIATTRRRAGAATTCRAGAEVDAMPTRTAPPRAACEAGRAASEGASMVLCACVEGRKRETEPSTRRNRVLNRGEGRVGPRRLGLSSLFFSLETSRLLRAKRSPRLVKTNASSFLSSLICSRESSASSRRRRAADTVGAWRARRQQQREQLFDEEEEEEEEEEEQAEAEAKLPPCRSARKPPLLLLLLLLPRSRWRPRPCPRSRQARPRRPPCPG